jgi:hypothetical protein
MEDQAALPWTTYLIAGLLCFVLIVAYKLLLSRFPCPACGQGKCRPLKKLPDRTQDQILHYFRVQEHRHPAIGAVFACDYCRTVFDDYSRERKSRNPDSAVYISGVGKRIFSGCPAECKECGRIMHDCTLNNPNIQCDTCGTSYAWKTHERSGYRFLMRLTDEEIRLRGEDSFQSEDSALEAGVDIPETEIIPIGFSGVQGDHLRNTFTRVAAGLFLSGVGIVLLSSPAWVFGIAPLLFGVLLLTMPLYMSLRKRSPGPDDKNDDLTAM